MANKVMRYFEQLTCQHAWEDCFEHVIVPGKMEFDERSQSIQGAMTDKMIAKRYCAKCERMEVKYEYKNRIRHSFFDKSCIICNNTSFIKKIFYLFITDRWK